jgi:hypothetical protein
MGPPDRGFSPTFDPRELGCSQTSIHCHKPHALGFVALSPGRDLSYQETSQRGEKVEHPIALK